MQRNQVVEKRVTKKLKEERVAREVVGRVEREKRIKVRHVEWGWMGVWR